MFSRFLLLSLVHVSLWGASEWVLIRTVDGTQVEGQTPSRTFHFERDGKLVDIPLGQVLSIHNAAPASDFEKGRIAQDLTAIQGQDRAARDKAVEELTAIG